MTNYNFDPMPYIAAKSAGGNMLLNTAATLPFPVRAAAGFSIMVSMTDGMAQCALAPQKTWQKMCGCSNWDSFVLNSRDYALISDGTRASKKSGASANQIADADRLIANKDIYRNLDQFTAMSDMDYGEFLDAVLLFDPFNDEEPPQALFDLIANSHKNMRVPVKLWCATKDLSVPYVWHQLYADWVSRCNGICELRPYTGDDGNHGTFVGGTTHVANNIPTPYGGTISGVNIGIVEAVEWFKRW
jgi:alpha-beta hydrolase superfamily lysophospholipase